MAVYSINNRFLEVKVNSLGAELISLLTSDGTELLWQASKDIWPRFAPVLFPIVGRLKNNSYAYNDSNYVLSQHGFARDKEFVLIEQSNSCLKFELTADEATLELFPFHFSLIISYTLRDNTLDVSYQIFNPDNKELLFSIGAHPGFSTMRFSEENIHDYYLEIDGLSHLTAERLQDGLLSGSTYIIDLDKGVLPLSVELFNNDALVFKNNQINSIKLRSKKSKNVIEMICKDWPYFGIWTKKGCDKFVCLEPCYGITDSFNSSGMFIEKEGLLSLNPHQSVTKKFSISIN
ncbi:MAG TPA: aldose 1-epimerase family protein [Bacteroidia bacterium]|nr:aldose 1-epimerase family protein [Bacteroidia bacterium]